MSSLQDAGGRADSSAGSSSSDSVACNSDNASPSRLDARYCFGVLLIVVVACIWVAASQLIEGIFQDLSFDKPYFLTYFNTCGFSLWLLGALGQRRWRGVPGQPPAAGADGLRRPVRPNTRAHLRVALYVSPPWMLANYLFNLSLDSTSVASNSVLSTTSNI
mmetsp:Transcript_20343/g.63779  ORF Transcript_20343/g.63779 Transcript_20343/m.63779 type:complete len:162 (-) Transcript_20343:22-507(-)